jgi:hypothetical protein
MLGTLAAKAGLRMHIQSRIYPSPQHVKGRKRVAHKVTSVGRVNVVFNTAG